MCYKIMKGNKNPNDLQELSGFLYVSHVRLD